MVGMPMDTVWPLEPHTRAKHEILREYLNAWFPILSSQTNRIVYLDGFAGPGIYSKGEKGSPIIAIQTAKKHTLKNKFCQIIFWFIEKDQDRCKKLQQVLDEEFPDLKNNSDNNLIYDVENTKFATRIKEILDELENSQQKLAPTFALLDPFGFSGLPMTLIKQILKHEKSEVLITLMVGFFTRFLDEAKEESLNDLFNTDEWKEAKSKPTPERRRQFLLNLYVQQLKSNGGAKFVRTFEMIDKDNKVIYYLVYGTKHWKGMDVIKKAMHKVMQGDTYRFSDRTDPKQKFLFDKNTDRTTDLSELIYQHFKGKTVSILTIEEFAAETPYIFKKAALKHLEKTNHIINVQNRNRRFTYPGNCKISFTMEP